MPIPQLHVEGKYIKDSSGKNVILRGVSIADPKSLMFFRRERPYDRDKIMELAVNEFNSKVIRLPIHPGGIDDVPGFDGDIKKYFSGYVVPAVDKAASLDVYSIIDLHIFEDYTTEEKDSLIREFWGIAAPYYNGNPNVLFELFNEPVKPDNWDTWKRYAQPWVDMIRKMAPENPLLIGGPRWCQTMAGAAGNPVEGKNIVYSAHCYPDHLKDFEENWGPLFSRYPVFFTEWGYEKGKKPPAGGTAGSYGRPFKKLIEERGCSWCAWCFDNDWWPRIFDKPWVLPEDEEGRMGVFVKDWLGENL